MSKKRIAVAAGLLVLLGALGQIFVPMPSTHAQQAASSPVQQIATKADAAVVTGTSATSAATITLTPPGGQSVYVTEIDITNCAGATAVTAAAVTSITTTNLTGSPAFTEGSGVTAGVCQPTQTIIYPTGLKSTTPGTAVTFVLPTFATNQTIRMNVAGYYAP